MEKQKKIISMFDEIAKTYDIANRVLSFGVDKSWRKKGCNLAYKYLGKSKVNLIVDVACGTGDMMDFWAKIAKKNKVEVSKILGIDPSIGMVEVGKKKFPEFEFKIATATDLEIDDNSADIISIAYGIRNVVEREKAFQEFYQKLNSGGLVVILEFTKSEANGIIPKIRDFYMKKMLPFVGGLISKNREAYKYLPDSIDNFITSKQMITELENSGFKILENRNFSLGVSSLFIAQKQ
jgi:demethylmenaquinone methyltransferase/2-methoxy-6-polyprenyl-1,4-benzoquinol methylase